MDATPQFQVVFRFGRALSRLFAVLLAAALLTSASPWGLGPAQSSHAQPGKARLLNTSEPADIEQQDPVHLPVVLSGPASTPGRDDTAIIVGYVFDAASDTPLAGAAIAAGDFQANTNSDGLFSLTVPPGDYSLTIDKSGFTGDERLVSAAANQTSRVQDVRLLTLDAKTVAIGAEGGGMSNSLNNSSVEFPAGALAITQTIRVTYLPNDALPGDFPDGSIPMGFSYFEPGGLVFPQGKEVLWTVAYDGDLPVGTDTLCYWWDGGEGRWRDPVPGKVVQLPNGQKALQARVPHFASSSQTQSSSIGQTGSRSAAYGHALPGVAGQTPGQDGAPVVNQANANQGTCQSNCPGSQINVGAGSVAESYTFLPVSSSGFPVVLAARYSSSNDTPTVTARVPFTITTQRPASAEWRIEFQGQIYTGDGFTAAAAWDTRNALGYRVAPGVYPFKASETFYYDSGARPTLDVSGQVEVRRGDIWPFGRNWLTAYDALLIDHGATVTIIQGDGQYLTYTRQPDGSYTPPGEDANTLVHAADGSWTRTAKFGFKEHFNVDGRLIRLEDRNGNTHVLSYEPNNATLASGQWGLTTRLASITDGSNRTTVFTYGAGGYIAKVTDPLNRVYNLTHDASGNLTGISDPLGRTTSYAYDGNGLLTRYTDPNGGVTKLTYDAQRRMTGHTDALGKTRTAAYSSAGNSFTDERGNTTTYVPNQYGAITRVQSPLQTVNYTFDAARRLSTIDQPPQSFAYDSQGNLTTSNSYVTTSYTYTTAFNQVSNFTDGAGNITHYDYDATGNLVRITDAMGAVSKFEYDATGHMIHATDPLNQSLTLGYDDFGSPLTLTDSLGFQTTMTYDAGGNLTQLTDSEGRVTQYAYDVMDRLTARTDALGKVTRYTYDANDNLTGLADARNNTTTYTYNARDQLTRETDALGKQTNYSYDAAGNLSKITNANGATVQYTYDAANRLSQEQYAGGGGVTYRYDNANGLAGFVDATSQVSYTYDSGIPGMPDVAQSRLLDADLLSTISYDYVAVGSTGNAGAATSANQRPANTPPPPNTEAYPGASASTLAPSPPNTEAYPGAATARSEPPASAPQPVQSATAAQASSPEAPATPYQETPLATHTDVCGAIGTDTTWTSANSPYVVTCDVVVDAGATLTIQPGVVVKFKSWYEDLWVNGTLNASGTVAKPIYFTSLKDDSVGGDANGDGNATTPAPDNWSSLRFTNTSTGNVLNHVVVRYGGGYYTENVYVQTRDITLTNSTIAFSSQYGLTLDNALPAALTNNSFLDNAHAAVWAPLTDNSDSIVLSGNTASGNLVNGFLTQGSLAGNVTWDGDDEFAFVVWEDVTVNAGAKLTLTPGTVVKFHDWYDDLWVNGALSADATADNPIYFTSWQDDDVGGDANNDGAATTPAPDNWSSLRFTATSAGSVLNEVVVRYGGGYYTEDVYVQTRDITLTNSTIAASSANGLTLDNVLPPALSNNHFLDNADSAIWAPLSNNADSITLAGNTASGNKLNGFVVQGSIAGDVTWDGDDAFAFIVWEDVTVNSPARLTLTPGTVIKFHDWYDDLWVKGALVADAPADKPIYFTSWKDDAVGGDSNNDGAASAPAPDDWSSLRFTDAGAGSVLDYAVVRYGGGYYTENVYVQTHDITLTNSTIAASSANGLMLDNVLPPSLSNNHFLDNAASAVWAPLTDNADSIALNGNSANGNQYNGFVIQGSIAGNVTWDGDDGLPFIVWEDVTVNTGAKLTLTPGAVVKFHDWYDDLWVNGTLVAAGTSARPIYFTSLRDHTVGGGSNNDGGDGDPAPDDWSSLRFAKSSSGNVLDHVVVRYGGGYYSENIFVNTGGIALTNSTIAASSERALTLDAASPALTGNTIRNNAAGIYLSNGAAPVLHENRIAGNSQYGLQNAGSAAKINAENNWWGSSSGPFDPSDDQASGGLYNPDGRGDSVNDGVDYDPWLKLTGLLYGMTVATGDNPVQTIRYSYDQLNRLTGLSASGPASFIHQYTYDAAGRLTASAPAAGQPGVNTSLEYDANARVTRLINRSADGSATLNNFRYTYDKAGNVLTVRDADGATTYTYDALYQLVGVSGPGLNETYAYDAVGNRTSKNGVSYTYNAANQLVSSSDGATYTYDENGNLRTKSSGGQTTTYRWDAKNRLTRIDFSDDTFAAYTYDAMGRRISKRDRAGATTYFVYNSLSLVQELDDAGVVIANYVYDGLDHPLSMSREGATYHYLYDQLGSVVGLIDDAGVQVVSYRYDPWGNVIATAGDNPDLANPFRFSGREWDDESGLYYNRMRYYDPQIGRFISRDPLRIIAPTPNLYSYVGNNVVNLSDPLGQDLFDRRWWQTVGGVGVGVVVGIPFGMAAAGAAGIAAIGWAVGGIIAGGVAGGGVAAASERVLAPPCQRDYWGAFGAGFRGGMTGGGVGINIGYFYGGEIVSGINTLSRLASAPGGSTVAQARANMELQMSVTRRLMNDALARGDWRKFEKLYATLEALGDALSKLPF